MTSLNNEVIKLSSIRETAKREMCSIVDSIVTSQDRSKVVILEQSLVDCFKYGGITGEAFKKEKGVEAIFPLTENVEFVQARNIVYFVRPTLDVLRLLVSHILTYAKRFPKAAVFIYFVPKKTLMAEHVLETEYKLPSLVTHLYCGEFDLDLVPLDDDVMSMEIGSSFKDLFLDGDLAMLHWIAKTIVKMQSARFGPIPVIRGKGRLASKVVNIVNRLQHEVGTDFISEQTPEIEAMCIVDRGCDMLTPMMTQLTYEGLIEELYGIDTAHFDPPFDMNTEGSAAPERDRNIPLNGGDRMFAEIRDKNFSTVGGILYQKSVWVKQSYERRKDVQHLKDLKEFMKGLPEMQEFHRLIGVHTNVASQIGKMTQTSEFRKRVAIEQAIVQQEDDKEAIEYIDELINKGEPLKKVLRLLCVMSLVNGGIKQKVYDQFKESLMLAYGIPQIVAAMYSLDRCGLLTVQETKSNFAALRKSCRLWAEELQEQQPSDLAYAYSGYAPLLSRIIEAMAINTQGWGSPTDVTELAPGERAEVRNDVEVPGNTRVVVIFVVGGITHAEIGTIRFLEQKLAQQGEPKHFVIATTNITSGGKIMDSVLPFKL